MVSYRGMNKILRYEKFIFFFLNSLRIIKIIVKYLYILSKIIKENININIKYKLLICIVKYIIGMYFKD